MRDRLVINVVRHGRTRSNRVGLVMGWADESIEPDQHDAADAVAARLAAAPAPVRVVSSPLARARDTAAPLAAALSVDLETDARLGELYQGPWQGLAESEVARRWPPRVVGVACGARDARSRRVSAAPSALCPGGRRL
jgi:broad specificity phosphatase PhoE